MPMFLRFALAAIALSLAFHARVASAAYNQWEYWADTASWIKFDTEKAAVEYMQGSGGGGSQYYQKPGEVFTMGKNAVAKKWYPLPEPPYYLGDWVVNGGATADDAIEAIRDHILGQIYPCAITQWNVEDWVTATSFLGLPTRQTKGITYKTEVVWWNPSTLMWTCLPPSGAPPDSAGIYQDREATCPLYMTADASTNLCRMSGFRLTFSRPYCICGEEVGNSTDVASGAKLIREVDYAGPGVELRRTFNSRSWPTWRHSFSSYITVDGPSTVNGFVNAEGQEEPLYYSSGGFLPYSGSGIEFKKVGTQWVLYYSSGAKDYFDTNGTLTARENTSGQVTTVNHDADNRVSSVVGPFGHTLTFAYDMNGLLETVTDPDGRDITYDYDSADRLIGVTYQDGSQREYHHEDGDFPSLVTGVTDENGDRYATYSYDDLGRAGESEHAGGYGFVGVGYSVSSSSVTDGNGNSWSYTFPTDDFAVRKILTKTRAGTTRTFTYPSYYLDAQQRPSDVTDERGVVTHFGYDAHHQTSLIRAYGTADARTTTYGYLDDETDRVTTVTSPSVRTGFDRVVTTTYTSDLPTAITITGYKTSGAAVSRAVELGYNSYGQVNEIDGPRTDVDDVTTLTYYECTTGAECGQLESVTNALGHVTTYDEYDDSGRLLEMTDPNGVVTEYEYDFRGRALTTTQTPPSGPARVTSYTYDDGGQLETAESPNGTVLTYGYDEAHNLASITDNDGNRIEYGYDLNGNRTNEDVYDISSSLKKTVEYTHDARDRIESINSAGSITGTVFDALGNLTSETDPNTHETGHSYDAFNRLMETVDALSGETEYSYDKNDFLTSVEAANGATTTYVYDDLGDLLSMTSPDTGTTTYTYDNAGNRLSQTDANSVTVEYTYDELNRVTDITYSTSTLDVSLAYDEGTNQKGRLTTMTDGSGVTAYRYDVFGNLTEEQKSIDTHTYTTGYAYDADNFLTAVTYPSGRIVDYTRSVLGQVTAVTSIYGGSTSTVASSIAYEPFGPLSGLTFGNGLVMARTFDQQYRLTGQITSAVQDLVFTYDDAGNIDEIADGVSPSLSQAFTQDELDRIDAEAGAYGANTYAYDEGGNRLTRVHTGSSSTTQTLTYISNSNRLATHGGNTVTIDAAGNITADPTESLSFTHGSHNRTTEAYVGAVLKASYVYNGHDQRVKKVEATGAQRTTVFHYGLGGELLGETIYNSGGAKIGERDYLYLDSLPIAQAERAFSGGVLGSSQFVYLHSDHLNSPRRATNGGQTVVWQWDSDAFGVGAANTDPDADTVNTDVRLRFPGQYADAETGSNYNFHRDYDLVTGRYFQADPIGVAGGLNSFLYVGGNPLISSDPAGLAQFGWRPLGEGTDVLKKLPRSPALAHEQIWFDDDPADNVGFFAGSGDGAGWDMCGEAGDVRADLGHDRKQYLFEGPKYDDGRMRKALANIRDDWNEQTYCFLGSNCQNFADALRAEYNRLLRTEQKTLHPPNSLDGLLKDLMRMPR